MNNIVLVQIFDPFHYLFEDRDGFLFRYLSLLLQVVIQVKIAHLSHDVHVIIGLEDVMELNDIAVTHSLHYIDLTVQVLQVETASEDALVDHLDRHWLTRLNDLAFVH